MDKVLSALDVASQQLRLESAIAIVRSNVDTVLRVLWNLDALREAYRDAEEDKLVKTHSDVGRERSLEIFVLVVYGAV